MRRYGIGRRNLEVLAALAAVLLALPPAMALAGGYSVVTAGYAALVSGVPAALTVGAIYLALALGGPRTIRALQGLFLALIALAVAGALVSGARPLAALSGGAMAGALAFIPLAAAASLLYLAYWFGTWRARAGTR